MERTRFVRTIDLAKKVFSNKDNEEQILKGFTSTQLAGIKNLAKRKLIEGALDELERAQPFLDSDYYYKRVMTLERNLKLLKTEKKSTNQIVEIRLVS